MEPTIDVRGVTKSYKELKALDDVSLQVMPGEILGLLGPNGSGKSTLINCLLALLKYDSGEIDIFGKPMTPDSYDAKSRIGVVFQDVALFETLTVYENVDYFCGLYIDDAATRKRYVEEAIALVDIGDYKAFRPKKLSGGLLRRLNIACGIAHKPTLIFLDEPTVAVDPQSRNSILDGIRALNEGGATIVYTTHYMEEAEQLCTRIVVLDRGVVIANGTSNELKNLVPIEEKVTVEVEGLDDAALADIRGRDNVETVTYDGKELHVVFAKGPGESLRYLMRMLAEHDVEYGSVFSERPTLNDVFLHLTGTELRD